MRRHPVSEARRLPRFRRAAAAAAGGQSALDDGDEEEAGDDDDKNTLASSPDKLGTSSGAGAMIAGDDNEPPVDEEEEGLLEVPSGSGAGAPGSASQHCFVAFDLLYLNGQVLTNRPMQERRALLEQAFTPQRGFL